MAERKQVEAHVMRLPVGFFDSTKSGVLISRIMTDAEGLRNLVGTGLVQLSGGIVTAAIALDVLFWLNWRLTSITILVLALFGAGMALAFSRLRPIFRERSKINAEVTGRLAESLGGVRVVKAYTAERRERLVFAQGVHRLFRNIARSIIGVSAVGAFSGVIVGGSVGVGVGEGPIVGNVAYTEPDLSVGIPILGDISFGKSNVWLYDGGIQLSAPGYGTGDRGIFPFVQVGGGAMIVNDQT